MKWWWFFGGALIVDEGGAVLVGLGRKYFLGPPEIACISSQDLSQSNKHDTFWHVVSIEYF